MFASALSSDASVVAAHVTQVAERLTARSDELVASMRSAIDEAVVDLGEGGRLLLQERVAANVDTILEMMRTDLRPEQVATPPAHDYAVRLARAHVPGTVLRRAYHLGTESLLSHLFEAVRQLEAPGDVKLRVLHQVSGWVHRYLDRATCEVLDLHEAERVAMLSQEATPLSQLVQRVVERQPVDHEHFASSTGHRLDQHHLAAVLWIDPERGPNPDGADRIEELGPLAEEIAVALGAEGRPLFLPVERSTAQVWFGLGDRPGRIELDPLLATLQVAPEVRVALGSVESQVTGFRRSLEQATAVRLVAVAATPAQQAMAYDQVGVAAVAMLARDLPATRRWVGEVLGPFADASEPAERTRQTVRTFLRTGSYAETSERLGLHRNTVKYRITKVEKERGRSLTDGRLDLELALHACQLLGGAVLRS